MNYYYLNFVLSMNYDFFHLLYILYYLEFFFVRNYLLVFGNHSSPDVVADPVFVLFESL